MMATAKDILDKIGTELICGPPEMTVGDAVRQMVRTNTSAMAVVRNQQAVGLFTEQDLLFRVVGPRRHPEATLLADVMSCPVLSCDPDDSIDKCASLLLHDDSMHLVVAERTGPLGLIGLRDIVRQALPDDCGHKDYFQPRADVLLQGLH